MQNHRIIPRIGERFGWVVSAGVFLVHCVTFAGETQFSARVDRDTVSVGDQVSLKISVKTDSNARVGEPQFDAPGFDVIGESSAISVSSQYDSRLGGFSMVNHQQVTKILRPLKTGNLKISNIHLDAGGKVFRVPDIAIHVVSGGAIGGQPSTQGNEEDQTDEQLNQRRATKPTVRMKNPAHSAFVRAEVSKQKAYKGEQIIVTYYLYHQAKVFNIQIDKFPVLNGFLREDLDIPVMNQRLETEQVELNGEIYDRSLLARYAAYPLENGTLHIDSMALKYNYYVNNHGLDDEDPFFGFFQQLAPRSGSSRSDQISVEVQSLPEAGRPDHFSGGIGEFNVTSALDKYEVRANEAITLTVKVEGQGNVSTIQEPKSKWPENIELYDTKGRTQAGRNGGGSKVFEFLLIPRMPGKVTLPSIEFSFFDPVKKEYYTKGTEAVQINVTDPMPGTSLVPVARDRVASQSLNGATTQQKKVEDIRYLKAPDAFADNLTSVPTWRILYWICLGCLGFFAALVGSDLLRKKQGLSSSRTGKKQPYNSKNWEQLYTSAKKATDGGAWQEVSQAYDRLADELMDGIDRKYAIGSRSFSRAQLKQLLVDEKGLPPLLWERITKVFEFADLVRYANAASGSETKARSELMQWVKECDALVQSLHNLEPRA